VVPWQWIVLGDERFLMGDLEDVAFIYSTGDSDYRDESRVEELGKRLGLDRVVTLHQVHGAKILMAEECVEGQRREGDGLITTTSTLGVGILTADCLPLLLFTHRVVALLHVGWRGLKEGIVERSIKYIKLLDNSFKEINTVFGPMIRECCYQVGKDMVGELRRTLPEEVVREGTRRRGGRLFFSLKAAVGCLLEKENVRGKIYDLSLCTCCSGDFPSYRRDGETASRFISIAWKK